MSSEFKPNAKLVIWSKAFAVVAEDNHEQKLTEVFTDMDYMGGQRDPQCSYFLDWHDNRIKQYVGAGEFMTIHIAKLVAL